ncbi:MAG: class I SAM-dependent methyltransferase [Candidatus Sericytochromatia bacterium]|nr:class I SAM-dependent methyltransferase [Candidatus Sericytochromatia bacterium]
MGAAAGLKREVQAFWNQASCGEALYLVSSDREGYEAQARQRYALEPYIPAFAGFEGSHGKDVLEIGVGLGADHQRFAEAGARLVGIDLTPRAIEHTRARLTAFGLTSRLEVGDAECLPFPDGSFDVVYAWGVLHHSPDTSRAIQEVWRVLRPGGEARVMVYHTWSLVGLMLWLRYALLRLRPWLSLRDIYARHLESPGTKAYTRAEARQLFAAFRDVRIQTVLTHGDLLTSAAGQRHRGPWLTVARAIWPRWLFRWLTPEAGLFLMVQARR